MDSGPHPQPPDAIEATLAEGFLAHGLLPDAPLPDIAPPRRWWAGPLDVEGLALGSVRLACAALRTLTGQAARIDTAPGLVAGAFNSSGYLRIDGRNATGFAPLSGFFPTADGWLRTHANYPHHRRALLAALGPTTADQLGEALRGLPSEDAERLIVQAGGVAAAVRTARQWKNLPAEQAVQPKPWAQFDLDDDAAPVRWRFDPAARLPLQGFRVLDLTRVIAGPTATRTLAAWGAQVLRLDPPHLPELLDQYLDTGFGKRSALLDLRRAAAAKTLHGLLAEADAVVLGYRPGALAALGVDPVSLRERYPRLLVAQLSAWGFDGPWASRRGFDSIVQAASGIADAYRAADGTPGTLPVQALDHATGYGLAAALVALAGAGARQGRGGMVRMSLERTAAVLLAAPVPQVAAEDLAAPQLRRCDSAHGRLDYVPPPFLRHGQQLDYPWAPPSYGSAALSWD